AKDILSLLVQANSMQGLPEARRMKDEDVLDRITTFLIAGHETRYTDSIQSLDALTHNKQAQTKVSHEVSDVSTDNPTMDNLNELPYLDTVVRETLHFYPPVSSTVRASEKDDCIPLSKPVRKGQSIVVPIHLVDRDKSIWGEDYTGFKLVPVATCVPGVILTFIGSPRACIGYRFSLLDLVSLHMNGVKTLVFTLVRAFGIQRPILLTDPNNSNQMPLVRPISYL
ncbi:cytochrome P450, partial [Phlegmacium glaucopus]